MNKQEIRDLVQMTALNEILTFEGEQRELIKNKLRTLYTQFNLSVFLSPSWTSDIDSFVNENEVFRDYVQNITVKILFQLESPVDVELEQLIHDMAVAVSLYNTSMKVPEQIQYIAPANTARFVNKEYAAHVLRQNTWLLVLMMASVMLPPELFDLK